MTARATLQTPTSPKTSPPPRWLDHNEQQLWRAYLASHRLIFSALEEDLRNAGMPFTHYEILVQLSEAEGRTLRMSELASFARTSRSRLTHAVERLEHQGWVRREECPTDRRGAFAVLTDEGMAALAAVAPTHVERVRELLFDPLTSAQQRQLRDLSLALVSAICPTSALGLASDPS